MKDKGKIPHGDYCYQRLEQYEKGGQTRVKCIGLCPYWSQKEDKPEQQNGYCSYLEMGDWESEHFSLLWDQVKECGENIE